MNEISISQHDKDYFDSRLAPVLMYLRAEAQRRSGMTEVDSQELSRVILAAGDAEYAVLSDAGSLCTRAPSHCLPSWKRTYEGFDLLVSRVGALEKAKFLEGTIWCMSEYYASFGVNVRVSLVGESHPSSRKNLENATSLAQSDDASESNGKALINEEKGNDQPGSEIEDAQAGVAQKSFVVLHSTDKASEGMVVDQDKFIGSALPSTNERCLMIIARATDSEALASDPATAFLSSEELASCGFVGILRIASESADVDSSSPSQTDKFLLLHCLSGESSVEVFQKCDASVEQLLNAVRTLYVRS